MFKPRSAFSLAATVALLAVVAPSQPFERLAAIAAPTAFEVPTSVPSDTALKVSSGSDAMGAISDALKADFESQFSGAQVNVDSVGADQAIQSLVDGDADLAAISRPLSVEEEAQGLTAVDVTRPKIAIIVGEDNPFGDSLTSGQFAQIFRGEITDWSELGGAAGAIRLVDRPAISDTRLALASYPVFQSAEFVTGSSAAQLDTDSTADIAKELGADGISYGLITEVENLDGVRILPMHKTMPTDLRYPFSQPFSFVYKGDASPAVAAFLGYAVGEPGQAVLKAANPLAGVVNAAGSAVGAASNAVESAADAAGNAVEGATDAAGNAVEGAVGAVGNAVEGATDAAGSAVEGATDAAGDAANQVAAAASQSVGDRNPQSTSRGNLWWLLVIPAACLGLVAWGARRRQDDNTAYATADGPNLSGVGKAGVGAAAGAAAVGGTAWAVAKQGGNVAKESLDNVGGVAQGGLGKVQGGLGNVGDAAKGGLGNIKGAAEKGVQGMKGGLDSAGNAVQDGLGSVGDGLKSGVTGAGNTLQGCADAVTGKVGDMGNVAKKAVNDSAKGANSLWQRVRDGVSQAGDKVDDLKGQASDVADDLKDLGK
ncbi:MAG: substrate-binding domain-containing protein [Cyanobacteria bacterium P01_F01_bin.116]